MKNLLEVFERGDERCGSFFGVAQRGQKRPKDIKTQKSQTKRKFVKTGQKVNFQSKCTPVMTGRKKREKGKQNNKGQKDD